MQNKTQNLDIVQLIESNPISRLNKTYETLFINKVKQNFTESQQNLFVSSFYCYLNYNSKTDYVIDLDDVWKWLGFARIDPAKRVLEKHFTVNIDYKIVFHRTADNPVTHTNLGGRPREEILMNINTFKKLCLKSKTKKADEIHDYFIKLEETFHEVLDEESNELRHQLQQKSIENVQNKENIMLESYHKESVVYLIHILDNLYKFGNTDNIKRRTNEHRREIGTDIKLVFCIKSDNNTKLEQKLKDYLKQTTYRKEQVINGRLQTELIDVDDINIIQDKLVELNCELVSDKQLILELKAEISDLKKQLETYQDGDYTAHVFSPNMYESYLSSNLQYSKSSKIDLKAIMDNLETYIKKNNLKSLASMYSDTTLNFYGYSPKFKNEVLDQIKKVFPDACYKDNRVKRHFVNLCFKDCTTHFSNDVYSQFVNDIITIGNHDKDNNFSFKFKVRTQTVINTFLKYITDKNIEPLFRMNEVDSLLSKELISKVCELTNSRVACVKHNGIDYQSFVGISLNN